MTWQSMPVTVASTVSVITAHKMLSVIYILVGFSLMVSSVRAAFCPYGYISGEWEFHIGNVGKNKWIKCDEMGLATEVVKIKLLYPDLAMDENGNRGFWTMISCDGVEVTIHGRTYTTYLEDNSMRNGTTYYCSDTIPGWTHDELGHQWACFQARKLIANTVKPAMQNRSELQDVDLDQLYEHDQDWIDQINAAQNLWTAKKYDEYDKMTLRQMMLRSGGRSTSRSSKREGLAASRELEDRAARLPDAFDWRDVDGVNYVTPVRNQMSCGSCYAFAVTAMNEARLRIHTKNTINITLSPQDVADCSHYSWGCGGGWPYTVGGQYGEYFGMVEEHCNPYRGNISGVCETNVNCPRHYFTGYRYVGGYYGATNEEAMRISLVANGPFVVDFLVTDEFNLYEKGIFVEAGVTRKFDPYLPINHAVLLVGYGTENGTAYWTCKNSWSTYWGEDGYFRIRRGANELAIESDAVEAFPVF